MAAWYIIFALPAVVLAGIDIELSGNFTPEKPNLQVYFSGNDVAVVSDDERKTFNLQDGRLKDSVRAYFGRRPDDAYVRSPTPWGDLYQSYGWSQVTRTLVPRRAKILAITSQPEIVKRQVFENNSTKPAVFNVGISHQVENKVSSSWSKDSELSIGQDITYGINIDGVVGGGTTSFGFKASWGENTAKTQTVTVGAKSSMDIPLKPGQGVIAELEATRGFIKVEVEYEASLSGDTAVNYGSTYRDHHFWALDVRGVMSSGGLSNSVVSRQVLEIGFFSNSKIIVHDKSLGTKFMELSF